MVGHPSLEQVRRIAAVREPLCVTIYGDADVWLHGAHVTDAARAQIREVTRELDRVGAPVAGSAAIVAALQRSATAADVPTDERVRAIAVFATEGGVDVFSLTTSPQPRVAVGDRFLVAPLVEEVLALHPPSFVLALSENRVRLIDTSADPPGEIDVPGLPQDLKSTTDLDLTDDRNTLAHLRTSERPKERLREYARAIDRALIPDLRRTGGLLVLAAAEPLLSIFRITTRYGIIAESGIPGNPDDLSAQELTRQAEPVVHAHHQRSRTAALARLAAAAREVVLADLDDIERALPTGAVATLFIDTGGRIPVRGEKSTLSPSEDRIDRLVRSALECGTDVVPVSADELSIGDGAAAILRYPDYAVKAG